MWVSSAAENTACQKKSPSAPPSLRWLLRTREIPGKWRNASGAYPWRPLPVSPVICCMKQKHRLQPIFLPETCQCPYTGCGQHRVTEPISVGAMVRNNFGKRRMQRKILPFSGKTVKSFSLKIVSPVLCFFYDKGGKKRKRKQRKPIRGIYDPICIGIRWPCTGD